MRNCGSEHQTRERKTSKAWAAKIAALNRPITAVTVSIITNILPPLHAHRTTRTLTQSKRFPTRIEDRDRVMIWCNRFRLTEPLPTKGVNRSFTNPLPIHADFCVRAGSPHFRRVPAAICLSLGAEAGCTGGSRSITACRWAFGRCNGNWGTWGFERQIG